MTDQDALDPGLEPPVNPYARGPLPDRHRPVDLSPHRLPTSWVQVAPHVWILENPNICMVCRRRPHGPIAHHAFIPDRASVATARGLGWAMPPEDPDR